MKRTGYKGYVSDIGLGRYWGGYGPGGPIKRVNLLAGMKSPEEVAAGGSETVNSAVPYVQRGEGVKAVAEDAQRRKVVQDVADVRARQYGFADAAAMAKAKEEQARVGEIVPMGEGDGDEVVNAYEWNVGKYGHNVLSPMAIGAGYDFDADRVMANWRRDVAANNWENRYNRNYGIDNVLMPVAEMSPLFPWMEGVRAFKSASEGDVGGTVLHGGFAALPVVGGALGKVIGKARGSAGNVGEKMYYVPAGELTAHGGFENAPRYHAGDVKDVGNAYTFNRMADAIERVLQTRSAQSVGELSKLEIYPGQKEGEKYARVLVKGPLAIERQRPFLENVVKRLRVAAQTWHDVEKFFTAHNYSAVEKDLARATAKYAWLHDRDRTMRILDTTLFNKSMSKLFDEPTEWLKAQPADKAAKYKTTYDYMVKRLKQDVEDYFGYVDKRIAGSGIRLGDGKGILDEKGPYHGVDYSATADRAYAQRRGVREYGNVVIGADEMYNYVVDPTEENYQKLLSQLIHELRHSTQYKGGWSGYESSIAKAIDPGVASKPANVSFMEKLYGENYWRVEGLEVDATVTEAKLALANKKGIKFSDVDAATRLDKAIDAMTYSDALNLLSSRNAYGEQIVSDIRDAVANGRMTREEALQNIKDVFKKLPVGVGVAAGVGAATQEGGKQ